MLVSVYDRVTGQAFLTSEVNADDVVARSGVRYGKGEACPPDEILTEAEWAKAANLPAPKPRPPEVNKVMAGEGLPMPDAEPVFPESTPERVELITSLRIAGATFSSSASTDELKAILAGTDIAPAEVDDLAHVRTEAGDSPEKLAKIEAEVDAANVVVDPLDHDADGKKGGSKPRAVRTPEEKAEREAVIAELKAKNIKYFAGATTPKLWEVLASG